MEKGTLASDVLCLLTQELGMLLTSEFAQGEASVTLLSLGMSPGKAALEKGVMVEKAQPGLGLASDVGKSREMTSALRGPPPFHQPPPSSLLMWDGKAFPHKKSNYRISRTTCDVSQKALLVCWGEDIGLCSPETQGPPGGLQLPSPSWNRSQSVKIYGARFL